MIMKSSHRFSVALSVIFIFLSSVMLFFVATYVYVKISDSIVLDINENTTKKIENFSHEIENLLHKNNTSLKLLARNNAVNKNIFNHEKTNIEIMKHIVSSSASMHNISIGDELGNYLNIRETDSGRFESVKIESVYDSRVKFVEHRDKSFAKTSQSVFVTNDDHRNRPWYQKSNNKNKFFVSNVYDIVDTDDRGIFVSYSEFDSYNSKIFTTTAIVPVEDIFEFASKKAVELGGNVLILDSNKNVVTFANSEDLLHNLQDKGSYKEIVNSMINKHRLNNDKEHKHIGEFIINSEKFIVIEQKFEVSDKNYWTIIYSIPERIFLSSLKTTMNELLIFIAILIIAMGFFTITISRQISKPIKEITNNINSLRNLELDFNVTPNSFIDEIQKAQHSVIKLQLGLKSFQKYIPEELVKIIVKDKEVVKVGGKHKKLAIMFTDIIGFTSISEYLPPKELAVHLSNYLDEMCSIVSKHQGTIDKFIGDSIMCFWGAPLDVDGSMKKSVYCAIEMQKQLNILNAKWAKDNKPQFHTRIGVHYGEVMVGNIGSSHRINYTITGDSVNVASRLEAINKEFNTRIMISEVIYEEVKNEIQAKYESEIQLKGKEEFVKIYSISVDS